MLFALPPGYDPFQRERLRKYDLVVFAIWAAVILVGVMAWAMWHYNEGGEGFRSALVTPDT